jgi:hypothetical protein
LVSPQALDLVKLDSALCEPGSKRVPQIVKAKVGDLSFLCH